MNIELTRIKEYKTGHFTYMLSFPGIAKVRINSDQFSQLSLILVSHYGYSRKNQFEQEFFIQTVTAIKS